MERGRVVSKGTDPGLVERPCGGSRPRLRFGLRDSASGGVYGSFSRDNAGIIPTKTVPGLKNRASGRPGAASGAGVCCVNGLVMEFAGDNVQGIVFYFVDKTMFIVNATGPVPR